MGKIYAFDLCIALPDPSEQSGLFPWSRFDSTGLKVRGSVVADNSSIVNGLGDTLTTFRKDGTSLHKGEETFAGGIKLQGQRVLYLPTVLSKQQLDREAAVPDGLKMLKIIWS